MYYFSDKETRLYLLKNTFIVHRYNCFKNKLLENFKPQ